MHLIQDPARLKALLARHDLGAFQTDGLDMFLVRFDKGEFLTHPLKPAHDLMFVVEGQVAIYMIRSDGTQYRISSSGDLLILGDVEFAVENLDGAFFIEALTPVTAVLIPVAPQQERLRQDSGLLRLLLASLAGKLQQLSHGEAAYATLEERLLHYIAYFCPEGRLTRMGETASQLHCSTRQLQRLLRRLTEKGVLRRLSKGCYQLTGEDHG